MADEDIKRDADLQRGAPKPRDRMPEQEDVNVLESINQKLQQANDDNKESLASDKTQIELQNTLVDSIKNGFTLLTTPMKGLVEFFTDNSLKELENRKEDIKIQEKIVDALENIGKQAPQMPDAPKGFYGTILATIGATLGAAAGLFIGFASAIGSQLLKFVFRPIGRLGKLLTTKIALPLIKGVSTLLKSGFIKAFPGFAKYISDLGDIFRNPQLKVLRDVKGKFKSLTPLQKGLRRVSGFIQSVSQFILRIAESTKKQRSLFENSRLTKLVEGVKGSVVRIVKLFKAVIDIPKSLLASVIKPFTSVINALFGVSKTTSKFATAIRTVINPFFQFFKFAAKVFIPLGKLLGKLFFPITIIMGIIDGVRGAIDGVTNAAEGQSKFVEGAFGALKGILVGFIGMPLDLLKSGIQFILGKLGMNAAADALKTFTFSDLIGRLVDGIKSLVNGIIEFFVGLFTFDLEKMGSGLSSIAEVVNNLYKSILRLVLPDPDRSAFTPLGFVSRVIPDVIYRYAGLNPDTGELLPDPIDLKVASKGDVGEDLATLSIDNEERKVNKRGRSLTATAVVDQSTKSAATQNIMVVNDTNRRTKRSLRTEFS